MDSIRRHIILGDVGRDFQLILGDGGVQVLDAGQRVHLGFDGRRHEGREPPGHHLGPERRVYDVEGLQVLLVFVRQYAVDVLEPVQRRVVVGTGEGMEIGNHVITLNDRIQQVYQIKQGLFQVDVLCGEPFATEYDHRSTQPVDSALVQTPDAGHLRQVLRFRPTQ